MLIYIYIYSTVAELSYCLAYNVTFLLLTLLRDLPFPGGYFMINVDTLWVTFQ